MLCLSGFELYSRWVPLSNVEHCLALIASRVAVTSPTKIKSSYPLNKMIYQFFFLVYPGIAVLKCRVVCCFDSW